MSGKKVLIVDDEKDWRDALSACLGDKYDIYTLNSGEEAIREYCNIAPDVVLMDNQLGAGNMFGTQAAAKILDKNPLAKIIMVSSGKMVWGLLATIGIKKYVPKNSGRNAINRAVEEVLAQ